MMKKVLNVGIVLLILYFIFLKLFMNSIDHKSSYHIEGIDEMLNGIEDKYHFVKSTEVVKEYGEIIIKIYYAGHEELVFDENIYEDVRSMFESRKIRQNILDREWTDSLDLKVSFIDNISFSTKDMVIEISMK